MKPNIDTIKKLMDQVRKIAESPKNKRRAQSWQSQEGSARDHWRGKPKKSTELEMIPFTVEPEIPMWGQILGFDIEEFYTNPVVYLENQLRMLIYRFQYFSDCTVIEKKIPVWLGTTFESSLFGAKTIFTKGTSPWLDRIPVFKDEKDLEKAEYPDFFKSGLMPLAHRFYAEMKEFLDDDFEVIFPEWGRGPFGVAFHIRGHDNLLLDLVTNPDFVHRLMQFLVDSRKKWVTMRAKFLGQPIPKGNLYNDEVNTPTLSPELVEEFVIPYETQLSEFHGGISYWHSCGDTTRLLDQIKQIPNLEMFNVGPWTSVSEAKRVFGQTAALEICLHSVRDIQKASRSQMEDRLRQIIRDAYGSAFTIRADGFHVISTLSADLAKIQEWIQIANIVCRDELAKMK